MYRYYAKFVIFVKWIIMLFDNQELRQLAAAKTVAKIPKTGEKQKIEANSLFWNTLPISHLDSKTGSKISP